MLKKKNSDLMKRYQESYESKDRGVSSGNSIMDYRKSGQEIIFYTPVEGRNRINILPYIIKTKNHPLVRKGTYQIGERDYMMDVWTHRAVGPSETSVICLKSTYGKACPVCEMAAALAKQGKTKEAKALKPSRRAYYNVQDLKEPDKVKIFETSHFLFEHELIEESRDDEEGGFTDFTDPETGMEIRFKMSKTKRAGIEFNEFKSFRFEEREEPISKELLEQTISFDEVMKVPAYDEIEKLLSGEDDDEDDDEPPAKKPAKKAKAEEVDEDEEQEEEVEEPPKKKPAKKAAIEDGDEEVEDEPPAKKPAKKKPAKKQVEEESEDEDDDEPPAKKPAKKAKAEDDDEDEEQEESPKAAKPATSGKCPFKHRFGVDCDDFDECDDCDMWNKCIKAQKQS